MPSPPLRGLLLPILTIMAAAACGDGPTDPAGPGPAPPPSPVGAWVAQTLRGAPLPATIQVFDPDETYGYPASVHMVVRRSASSWRIDVTATSAHSSGVFRDAVGAGAIYEAGRILEDFYAEIRGEENLTFNAATMVAGTEAGWDDETARGTAFGKTNVVPPTAVITGDIRTLTDEQLRRTREKMGAIVARSLPGTRSEIRFTDGYPSMPPAPGNYELLEILSQVSQGLEMGPVVPFDPGQRGAADISFVAAHVDAALGGLGPDGSGSHTVEETVNLHSVERAAQRAALLMYRLTR